MKSGGGLSSGGSKGSGVARGVSRLPGTPPPPKKKLYIGLIG